MSSINSKEQLQGVVKELVEAKGRDVNAKKAVAQISGHLLSEASVAFFCSATRLG